MRTQNRRRFTGQEKVSLLREHLLEGATVSDVCDRHGVNPTQFYRWQQEFFQHGAAAFERTGKNGRTSEKERIATLEAKLVHKDSVIAEIMTELIAQKKRNGEI
jgi:transposase-like protein